MTDKSERHQHCEHECVCGVLMVGGLEGDRSPCDFTGCKHDTRSTPAPASDPEDWRKEVAKFTEEDPLLMAYVKGQEAGRAEATASENGRVLDELSQSIDEHTIVFHQERFIKSDVLEEEIRSLRRSQP